MRELDVGGVHIPDYPLLCYETWLWLLSLIRHAGGGTAEWITNLGLNLASAHMNIARSVLANGGSILQDYGTSFSGLQGSLRIHQ
jgi:hypothetical protein